MSDEIVSTQQKALEVNLDDCKYGTIAEIGAGQEVARNFFQAGAAAGTVAKSISAYDMQISDSIYGEDANGRYVSRSRLEKMLETEFDTVVSHLRENRPANSTFFAFADTVAARGFRRRSDCHGWMGIRAQLYPGAPPSEVIIHVRMRDNTNKLQQQALGVLGVNLIHGTFFLHNKPKRLIESLMDNIDKDRLEIDAISFSGPYFDSVDNRLMALHLVETGLTHAVMFSRDGEVLQSSDLLYKKNVLVARGSFRPFTKVNQDMINSSLERFAAEDDVDGDKTVVLAEITMANLMSGGEIDTADFLDRVDILCSLGYTVLISNYLRFFRLRNYIGRYTQRRMGIVVGVRNVCEMFDEAFYDGMPGGMMEAFGRLVAGSMRLYVYPQADERDPGRLFTLGDIDLGDSRQHLLDYLVAGCFVVPIDVADKDNLRFSSQAILRDLKKGDGPWKEGLPEPVYAAIMEGRLFGLGRG